MGQVWNGERARDKRLRRERDTTGSGSPPAPWLAAPAQELAPDPAHPLPYRRPAGPAARGQASLLGLSPIPQPLDAQASAPSPTTHAVQDAWWDLGAFRPQPLLPLLELPASPYCLSQAPPRPLLFLLAHHILVPVPVLSLIFFLHLQV